ncbi:hypothetical protein [Nocardia carnea]|uniref:Uncharacterized protein n=1 Tax=Nocardia carnea TaxID=37328 RepID=A0ABW7TJB0_9NOCA|nr:hypothetical protein [Nocardia carnea]
MSEPFSTARKVPVALRHTVIDDCEVVWCRSMQTIRVLQLRTASAVLLAATGPGTAPDLADTRERFPHLESLWDAVRHQFWTRAIGEEAAG